MEFSDALHLRYCRTPPNLSTHCNGCGAKFCIAHGLQQCKKGLSLSFKTLPPERALIPSVVRDDPQIDPGRSADVEETEGMPTQQKNEVIYYLRISGNNKLIALWTCEYEDTIQHPSETGSSPSLP